VDAEACARKRPENMNLRAKKIASCLKVLIEQSRPREREKHAPDCGLGKTALVNEFRQAGARRPGPSDEQEKRSGPVDRLCSMGSSTVDAMSSDLGRDSFFEFQHMDLW